MSLHSHYSKDSVYDDFAARFPELAALFNDCDTRKDVQALMRKLNKEIRDLRADEYTVPMCAGAVEAFKIRANENTRVEIIKQVSGKEMRVAMADRYLSRNNRVGRLR